MISLNQAKDPLPPMDDVVEFDVHNNTKGLEKNLKLQGQVTGEGSSHQEMKNR